MKILVLNRGSSSIKCYLYTFPTDIPRTPVWEAHLQWKNNFEEPFLVVKNAQGENYSETLSQKNAAEALKHLLSFLIEGKTAVLSSFNDIEAACHRIVHGGKDLRQSTLITPEVKEKIRALSELAPLHNLPELEGIDIFEQIFKTTPQIAVFDTAFHHTLSPATQIYPGPYAWYEQGIQRYGFHGISFQYCARRTAEMLNNNPKMVVCHLGSGASLCAIEQGKSIDTTMGFTPLEGLMMDTRSGSIDPGILLYLLEKKKKSPSALFHTLYYESGLLGLSGSSSDMRDIVEKSSEQDPRATLALEVYLHRLNAQIGSMIASLKGIDVLVFTAGIGENSPLIREKVCEAFSFLGLKINSSLNTQTATEDRILSTENSKIKVLLIHTQEAFEIARECWKIVSTNKKG